MTGGQTNTVCPLQLGRFFFDEMLCDMLALRAIVNLEHY